MKILAIERVLPPEASVVKEPLVCACYPDSSLLRNNEDFYIPEFTSNVHAFPGLYFKIAKIAKCVDAAFVQRYISEVGVAINFIASDLCLKLQSEGKSTDVSRGFDKSFAVSNARIPFPDNIENEQFHVSRNSIQFIISLKNIYSLVRTVIPVLSSYYTLKIGDYVFIPLLELHDISIDDEFKVALGNKVSFSCKIQ